MIGTSVMKELKNANKNVKNMINPSHPVHFRKLHLNKNQLKFLFSRTSLWWLKRFYEGLIFLHGDLCVSLLLFIACKVNLSLHCNPIVDVYLFKRQSHKMVKHTQTIRRQFADELFECV